MRIRKRIPRCIFRKKSQCIFQTIAGIVLSGTDSLGFTLAETAELHDRSVTIHTTFIPFREYSRLLGLHDIDEYIRYGGTFRAGETDFDDPELMDEGISFRDDETMRRYIDTAAARNIQHS